MTPHPFAEILRAIADGKQIQRLVGIDEWHEVSHDAALYYIRESTMRLKSSDFRVKPEPKIARYRVAQMRSQHGVNYTYTDDGNEQSRLDQAPSFIRWLTDWIEYEVSE